MRNINPKNAVGKFVHTPGAAVAHYTNFPIPVFTKTGFENAFFG